MQIAILSKGSSNPKKRKLYTARRLAEAAQERGHTPKLLSHTRCYMGMKQGIPNVHYRGRELPRIDAVIPRLGPSDINYGSAIVRQFEMRDVYSLTRSIALVRSRDKLRSLQLLSRAEIDIPKTAIANQATDINDLVELVGGPPLIVKLVESTHGKGVVIAETKKAAKSVIQAFYSINQPILVQEFIEEAGGADIRAVVVGGRVVGAMERQGLHEEFRSNIHQGGSGSKVKLDREERRIAIKATKQLGLDVAGVDLVRSERGPLVIEVNPSPGLEGIETATGRDIASKIIHYVEINAGRKPKKDKVGA
jgi:ribosomal protein S6--L-glutamate ligase